LQASARWHPIIRHWTCLHRRHTHAIHTHTQTDHRSQHLGADCTACACRQTSSTPPTASALAPAVFRRRSLFRLGSSSRAVKAVKRVLAHTLPWLGHLPTCLPISATRDVSFSAPSPCSTLRTAYCELPPTPQEYLRHAAGNTAGKSSALGSSSMSVHPSTNPRSPLAPFPEDPSLPTTGRPRLQCFMQPAALTRPRRRIVLPTALFAAAPFPQAFPVRGPCIGANLVTQLSLCRFIFAREPTRVFTGRWFLSRSRSRSLSLSSATAFHRHHTPGLRQLTGKAAAAFER